MSQNCSRPRPTQNTGLTLKDGTLSTLSDSMLFQLHGLDVALPVTCDLCRDVLHDWESFDVHTAGHAEARLFPCQLCNCTYKSWENLVAHRKAYHRGDMLSCKECNTQKCFPNLVPVRFAVGTSSHGCEECNVGFGTYLQLARHYTTEHRTTSCEVTSPLFSCPACKITFHSSEELSTHVTSAECFAGRSFINQSLLKPKRKLKDSQSKLVSKYLPKRFICEYCAREFSNNRSLKLHVQRHLGERPYACLFCPKRFYTKQQLSTHTHQHTGLQPYECKLCDKTFMSSNALYMHRKIHTAFRTYNCAHCGKTFFWRTAYVGHVRLHSRERPFACHLCKKAFAVKGKLNSHLKWHKLDSASSYLYLCTDCNRIFSTKVELVDHQNERCCVTVVTPDIEEGNEQNQSNTSNQTI